MTTPPTALSPAEAAVLAAAARGLTVAETAAERGVSPETVRSQRKVLLAKLGARNMTQAVAMVRPRRVSVGFTGTVPADRVAPAAPEPINERQLVALHAKVAAIARASSRPRSEVKAEALEVAAEKFGRVLESANDLSYAEASFVLDHLAELEERVPA
ncbi:MAG TPA: LuxR C-terminal-related transcriptional regulator [Gaiellaceae bacterium]|nr:LuxR C-terminal-related transcriptional regulator [Gaiellaceae bacterium]